MSPISVITPVFNGERYLAAALQSIHAQTLSPAEVIVVNDGSSDRSADIASSFESTRLLNIPHAGVGVARNQGVRAATGTLLAFLDADDLWLPHALESLLSPLLADPQLDAVFGGVQHFVSEDCPAETAKKYFVQQGAGNEKMCGAMLIRSRSFHRAGGFDEGGAVDFIGWYQRAQEAGLRMAVIAPVVLRRRIHGSNTTILHRAEVQRDYLALVRESLARRRASGGAG